MRLPKHILRRLRPAERRPGAKHELSICITIKNRSLLQIDDLRIEPFPDCISSIVKSVPDAEIVIADYESDDRPLLSWLPQAVEHLSLQIKHLQGDFSRGRGLNEAASIATGNILLFLDADMLVTQSFVEHVSKATSRGSACFPVCWSYDDPEHSTGYWCARGYGNCAIPWTTFQAVEGWPELDKWGGEDWLLYGKVRRKVPIVRERIGGFFHQWHPDSLEWKNRYAARQNCCG